MAITKHKSISSILINGKEIKQATQFKYLESRATSEGRSETDITTGIGMAKSASMDMQKHKPTKRKKIKST